MLLQHSRELLEAIDHIGPVSVYALSYHVTADAFETRGELNQRLEALADEGYLRRRSLPDVTGESIIEYDTFDGWEQRIESATDTPGGQ